MNRFFMALGLTTLVLYSCASAPSVPPQTLAVEYYNLGNVYFQMKKYKEAGEYYQKALSYDSSNNQAVYNLARSLAEQGKWEEAGSRLTGLQQADPKNLLLLKTIAYLQYLQDKKSDALSLYEQIIQEGGGDTDTLRNAGLVASEIKNSDRALVHLESYQKAGGTDPKTLKLLGSLYLDLKKDTEAVAILEPLIQSLDSPQLVLLSEAYIRLEAYDKALEAYESLSTKDKTGEIKRPDLWFDTGVLVLEKLQDPNKAMDFFISAVDQGFSDKDKVKQFLAGTDLMRRTTFVTFFEEKGLSGEPAPALKP